MPSKNKFEIFNDEIHISKEGWDKIASTTFREDYFDELTSVTWTASRGYLTNGKHGLLHRYIMKKWYGEDMVQSMSEKGWIVDHINNEGLDCRISNLEFLATRHNVAKGQTLDVEAKAMKYNIALNIFKDFSTGLYQITIFFNDDVYIRESSMESPKLLNALKLLYDCDYRLVINDAESILLSYDLEKKINLSELKCIEMKKEFPIQIELSEEEKGNPMIIRDGKAYLVLNNNVSMDSVHFDKGWKPKSEY